MADPDNDTKEYLSQFVGEGKKYKSEEDLAKAYANADSFIQHLTKQTEELKTELDKRMAVEDFIKQTTNQDQTQPKDDQVDPNPGNSAEATTPETPESNKVVNESEIIERIKAELKQEQEEQSAKSNLDRTVDKLREVYGEDAKINEAIKAKAQEIGVTVEWLQDAASRSPSAFFGLLGLDKDTKPGSKINPALNSAGLAAAPDTSKPQPGTKAYYDEIRRTDPSKYFSRTVQLEIYKAAEKNPAEFGLSTTN